MEFVKKFIELTRGYTLLMSLGPCLILYSYLHNNDIFTKPAFFMVMIALFCVHLGVNLYDDYKDIKKQLELGKSLEEVSFDAYIPKAVLIRNKTFSIRQVRFIIMSFFIFAAVTGICFAFASGWQVLLFMLAGGILSLLYPCSSKFYCQELIVGLLFGPLLIMGANYALANYYDAGLFLLSWAVFFTTIVLLHSKNIMDWEFDIKNGKKTLAFLSGSKENAIKVLAILISIPYLIILSGVLFNQFNPKMLFVFLTLPVATKLISSMKDYIRVKDVEFKPRWYWGFFEGWQAIKERRIDFFMFRFYLARNFAFLFAVLAAIGAVI